MAGITHSSIDNEKDAVAIIEWNQRGHHETYLQYYTQTFLDQGRPVIVLCKQPDALTHWITENTRVDTRSFIAIELPDHTHRKSRTLNSKLSDWLKRRKIKQALKQGETELKVKCNWIHLACFYEHQGRTCKRLIETFNLPWTGLYLHPNLFYNKLPKSRESEKQTQLAKELLHDARLRGFLMLDEYIAPKVQAYCNCPIVHAPDFTNSTLPKPTDAQQKVDSSSPRTPTIGILGNLLPSKGIIATSELILKQKLTNHSLILGGEVNWDKFNASEQQTLRDIQQSPFSRTNFERIKDESEYNALIKECDVLLATYKDFPHSSNTLTKAAIFEIPVIVNDGHLMAQRVRDYRLGEVIPDGDLNVLRDAILKITTNTELWIQTNQPRWEAYRTHHSIESLADSIQRLGG